LRNKITKNQIIPAAVFALVILTGSIGWGDTAYTELNTLFQAAIGKKLITGANADRSVLKLGGGGLGGGYLAMLSDDDVSVFQERAEIVFDLYEYVEKYDASRGTDTAFVFSVAPGKIDAADIPVENKALDNKLYINEAVSNAGIDIINWYDEFEKAQKDFLSAFYRTDHHWLPQTGLWAAGVIAERLSARYGIEYDAEAFDPDSYTYETLENWFLGYFGKQVGKLYAGVDDFVITRPKFATALESESLYADGSWEYRSGTLEDALYWYEYAAKRDLYGASPYSLYSGGDFAVQIIRNLSGGNGKKLLIIRHSFACVVSPFLSLAYGETRTLDLRPSNSVTDLHAYFDEYQPDAVLFLW